MPDTRGTAQPQAAVLSLEEQLRIAKERCVQLENTNAQLVRDHAHGRQMAVEAARRATMDFLLGVLGKPSKALNTPAEYQLGTPGEVHPAVIAVADLAARACAAEESVAQMRARLEPRYREGVKTGVHGAGVPRARRAVPVRAGRPY